MSRRPDGPYGPTPGRTHGRCGRHVALVVLDRAGFDDLVPIEPMTPPVMTCPALTGIPEARDAAALANRRTATGRSPHGSWKTARQSP
ncbi:hypothetical protein [Nocardioides acrostichi]|uniref:Uncharacterized protein n=1 Tax=Nocardioides acrostichi TaxID=2784339 RepID=A0A930YDK6_9ACTN|nr:hypothetical protein [Nocardioides acrostichi]MBF4162564.1 hypothetical protein [Nocardioides acrostichi]